MKTIAITGGIGSGKSVVSKIMLASGYPVYDSDSRAKELTDLIPAIKEKLTALIGMDAYKNGLLNRKLLSGYIFASAQNREVVDSIIHPEVKSDFIRWRSVQKSDIIFMESAILFESGFDNLADEIWCVTAPLELRIERIVKRNGIMPVEAKKRISAQMDDETRNRLSEYIIVNDGNVAMLPQLKKIFQDF
ncbi:MAG: dephospho-CoA kinase [Bacteroidales bacterium]